jgi:hypothetical protein
MTLAIGLANMRVLDPRSRFSASFVPDDPLFRSSMNTCVLGVARI